MRIICGPKDHPFPGIKDALEVILYGAPTAPQQGSVGAAVLQGVQKEKLAPAARAWDFLSIALSVVSADCAGHRATSADGWTREFELSIAVADPDFWNAQASKLSQTLGFLTTDIWCLTFVEGGLYPTPPAQREQPKNDCVVLLSGGLDSLIGAIDLSSSGRKPLAVSQTVRGDASKQIQFAQSIGGGLRHFQVNHNADVPDPENPPTQRARSLVFLAYATLIATSLELYGKGSEVDVFICENGFIAVNPPLTGARIGSLSTRTAHPQFLKMVQDLLVAAGLRVRISNPYRATTKGEMMAGCRDQAVLGTFASQSTSCGRFLRFGYRHCGRCMPCQIRRAAFLKAGQSDTTAYVFDNIGKDDAEHAGFDDVRSAAMAIAEVKTEGLNRWVGASLNAAVLGDTADLRGVLKRGLAELEALHRKYGVK
jgi:7-cyano-7-deazaguanine synthase in queuosine biosynthesis